MDRDDPTRSVFSSLLAASPMGITVSSNGSCGGSNRTSVSKTVIHRPCNISKDLPHYGQMSHSRGVDLSCEDANSKRNNIRPSTNC